MLFSDFSQGDVELKQATPNILNNPFGSMGRLYIYLHENHKNQPFM